MNKVFFMIVCTVMMLTNVSQVRAQKSTSRERVNKEQLAELQARHIAKELNLDEATTAKYVQTYCEYQREVWNLGHRLKIRNSDAEADIKARFERSQRILSLREKYYEKYSRFMTPEQIKKAYQLEHKSLERMKQHHKHHGSRTISEQNVSLKSVNSEQV